jgi:3-dehydroquinate synthase
VIGGGAVLDAVGFATATFHRGVRHVRCPSTVLAQNDSGVGVKNGVNSFGLKNLLGVFAPPFAVINDSAFIDALPARDKRCGMAEAVKVALIRDREFFVWLERTADALARFEPNALDILIQHCAKLHMNQIRTVVIRTRQAPRGHSTTAIGPPTSSRS